MRTLLDAFLLGFPALFSILSPLNNSLVFRALTSGASTADRAAVARRVAIYSLGVMLVSLWLGEVILGFFGVSLSALRVAGGLMIAAYGWELLQAGDIPEPSDTTSGTSVFELAVVPLTMPLTAGPGTIAVMIGLSAHEGDTAHNETLFLIGLSLASVAAALAVFLAYRFVDLVVARLGAGTMRVLTRLIAFVLLCIGVQILIMGVQDVARPLLAAVRAG